MGLSKDLISQFAKVTTDDEKIKETKEQTVYGKAVEYNGELYARIDGSDVLTPISRTTDVKPGERVTVLIKDHSAVVTGNLSSPSARTDDVQEIGSQISEFEIVIADKVSTIELDAERARIGELEAENVTINGTLDANNADIEDLKAENVTISDTLTAKTAEIENLKVNKLDATVAEITYATIADAEITDANIYNLTVSYGDFVDLTTNEFAAVNGHIDDLETNKLSAINADIHELNVTKATIAELEATNANVTNLQSEVADINTLVSGNLTSENIQSLNLTSKNTVIEDAMIKDAMISDLSVDKLKSGDISTNKFNLVSDSGNFTIADNTIQVTDGNKVRVQIGKDASSDYNMYVWDPTGKLMFNATGITKDAIQSPIIRDDMVSANANINAEKIDISSLFSVINDDDTETLNSSKIMYDSEGQTLNIKLNSLTTSIDKAQDDIDSVDSTVSTLKTEVNVAQGSIDTMISKTDLTTIEGQGTTFYEQYNTTKSTLDSWERTLGNQESTFSELVNSVKTNNAKISATPTAIKAVLTSDYMDGLDTIKTMKSSISLNQGSIDTIISKTDRTTIEGQDTTFYEQYNTTKSTVDSWEVSLGNQNTTFPGLLNSVRANNAKISATPTTIKAAVTSSYIDTLNTIKTMKSSISLNEAAIEAKVSKNGVIAAINLDPGIAKIQASKIKLEGVVTANSRFKILTDGSMVATNANITGTITSTNAIITGGYINIESSSETYSRIRTTYGEWINESSPLQVHLTNTSNRRETIVQAGGIWLHSRADGKYSHFAYNSGMSTPGFVLDTDYLYVNNRTEVTDLRTDSFYASNNAEVGGNLRVQGDIRVAGWVKTNSGKNYVYLYASGTNWKQYSDGTMVVEVSKTISGSINKAWGSLYYLSVGTISFPKTFIGVPSVTFTNTTNRGLLFGYTSATSRQINTMELYRPVADTKSYTYKFTVRAVGRWQ